jgi:hypothetical protein
MFGYDGSGVGEFRLNGASQIYSVVSMANNRILALANGSIHSFSVDQPVGVVFPLYELSSVDLVVNGEDVYLFNQVGVWKLRPENGLLQLVHWIGEGQDLVPNSANIVEDGSSRYLQFTTVGSTSGSGAGVYRIKL